MRKDFFNNKGRLCGWWTDGVYRKRVDSTKHRLLVMNAYGIDESIINECKTLGTREVRIQETDTQRIYYISFEKFVALGVKRNLDTPQIFLPIHYFQSMKLQ